MLAYRKSDGETVGSVDLPGPTVAGAMTYMAGGRQYIAVAIQGNGLVSYSLETGRLPVGVALTGWDRDGDGLRDDLQEVLGRIYADRGVRRIIEKGAQAYQLALVASRTEGEQDDETAAQAIARFIGCLNGHPGVDRWRELGRVRSLVLDTDARYAAYEEFDAGRGALPRLEAVSQGECTR